MISREIASFERGRMEFENINRSLQTHPTTHGLMVIAGPCAVDAIGHFGADDKVPRVLQEEAQQLDELSRQFDMPIFHRLPVWKPRTNVQSWRGLLQSNPSVAINFLHERRLGPMPIALEVGSVQHQKLLSFASIAWIGARSIADTSLHDMVVGNSDVPMLIKNGVDEDIDHAFKLCTSLSRTRRTTLGSGAPVMMMHRAGASANPKQWEHSIRVANEMHWSHAQNSKEPRQGFFIDASHGAEFAHRPKEATERTPVGQLRAAHHALELIARREVPSVVGLMLETSDISLAEHKKTDPNISFSEGLEIIKVLGAIHQNVTRNNTIVRPNDSCHI